MKLIYLLVSKYRAIYVNIILFSYHVKINMLVFPFAIILQRMKHWDSSYEALAL